MSEHFDDYETENEHKIIGCGCLIILDICLAAIIVVSLFAL